MFQLWYEYVDRFHVIAAEICVEAIAQQGFSCIMEDWRLF